MVAPSSTSIQTSGDGSLVAMRSGVTAGPGHRRPCGGHRSKIRSKLVARRCGPAIASVARDTAQQCGCDRACCVASGGRLRASVVMRFASPGDPDGGPHSQRRAGWDLQLFRARRGVARVDSEGADTIAGAGEEAP